MRRHSAVIVLVVWLISGITPLSAHHAFATEFDLDKAIHLEGNVTRVEWTNPHVYVNVEVFDSNNATVDWRVELPSLSNLANAGLTNSIDTLTVHGLR